MSDDRNIVIRDVSKFYGDVLGVNRVDLEIEPGITSLVGPNGSGKSTLMNLLAGLLRPTRGEIRVLGLPATRPQDLFRRFGYCTQYDSFPRGATGWQFVFSYLLLHGLDRGEAERLTARTLERVGLVDSAHRRIAGYSKGMRQRIKLAQAIAHGPQVMVLDEPLNGLDPMVRAETIELFRQLAGEPSSWITSPKSSSTTTAAVSICAPGTRTASCAWSPNSSPRAVWRSKRLARRTAICRRFTATWSTTRRNPRDGGPGDGGGFAPRLGAAGPASRRTRAAGAAPVAPDPQGGDPRARVGGAGGDRPAGRLDPDRRPDGWPAPCSATR